MLALIRMEIRKILAEKKSLIGFLQIAIINVLFSLAFYLRSRGSAEKPHEMKPEYMISDFMNAVCYTQTILSPCVYMIFPMVLAILGAYILAGEVEQGSVRMVLIRPVSRWQVLVAKFVVLSLYSTGLLALLGIISYGVACLQFPATGYSLIPGPMYLLRDSYVLPPDIAVYRLILSYVLAIPMLMSLSAMSLVLALIMRHYTSGAILSSTVYFACYVIGWVPFLSAVHKYLPTRYWQFWKFALMDEIPWDTIGIYSIWTFGYTILFLVLGSLLFNLRDV